MIRIATIAGLAVLTLMAPAAAEVTEDAYAAAEKFAVCASLYDAFAGHVESRSADLAEAFRGFRNGALLTAAVFVVNPETGVPNFDASLEWARNVSKAQSPRWRAILTHAGAADAAVQDQVKICAELSSIQADVLDVLRRGALNAPSASAH